MKFKKFLAAGIAAVMAMSAVSLTAYAEEGDYYYDNDFTFIELEDGTLTVIGYSGEGGDVVIPSEVYGKTVSQIGSTWTVWENDNIVSIEIPATVIRYSHDSDVSMMNPFRNFSALTTIKVDNDNPYYTSVNGILFTKDLSKLVGYPSGRTDVTYEIPETVTYIAYYAFAYNPSITYVKIPNSVTNILLHTFYDCTSLKTVDIPDSVVYIGVQRELIDVQNYSGVGTPSNSFYGCASLTDVNVSDGNKSFTSIDGVLFSKDMTVLYYYPQGKETSAEYIVPNSVNEIDMGSFHGNIFINSVTLPDGVEEIEQAAFSDCSSLTSIIIPASVNYINDSAFAYEDEDGNRAWSNKKITIYGYKNSYAESWAERMEIKFSPISLTVEDENVTVEGALPYATTLNVEKTDESETSVTYDITLSDSDGNAVQPTETVSVKLPVPEGMATEGLKVYRVESDGKYTDMNATYADGFMTFTTEHFSKYVITAENLPENTTPSSTTTDPAETTTSTTAENSNTQNGASTDKNEPTGVVLALLPAAFAAAGIIISRKRK